VCFRILVVTANVDKNTKVKVLTSLVAGAAPEAISSPALEDEAAHPTV